MTGSDETGGAMTDIKITRLCAEAMGIELFYPFGKSEAYCRSQTRFDRDTSDDDGAPKRYIPLHNDAQAMALVKKFRINIMGDNESWWAMAPDTTESPDHHDLNRAICECVARMQNANTAPKA